MLFSVSKQHIHILECIVTGGSPKHNLMSNKLTEFIIKFNINAIIPKMLVHNTSIL